MIKKMSPTEAMQHYYSLSPQTSPAPGTLTAIYESLLSSTENSHAIVAANCALELSGLTKQTWKRSRWLGRSEQLLSSHIVATTRPTVQNFRNRSLSAHLPLFRHGPEPVVQTKTKRNIFQLLLDVDASVRGNPDRENGPFVGVEFELGASVVIGSMGHRGLFARKSLDRQDGCNTRVDGKKYSWDFSVFSNGREIPPGEYRAEIKSPGEAQRMRYMYHPEIAMFSTVSLGLGENVRGVFETARLLVSHEPGTPLPSELHGAEQRILEKLAKVGPIDHA